MIEINLASVCAALPVFWPVIEDTWGRIFVTVTYEFKITREYGIFVPRKRKFRKPPLTASASDRELTAGVAELGSGNFGGGHGRGDGQGHGGGRGSGDDGRGNGSGTEWNGEQPEWDPYVGDAKTGLGDYETIVQSPAEPPEPPPPPLALMKKKGSFLV